jgi:hypothetical protein
LDDERRIGGGGNAAFKNMLKKEFSDREKKEQASKLFVSEYNAFKNSYYRNFLTEHNSLIKDSRSVFINHLDILLKAFTQLFTISIAGYLTTLGLENKNVSNLDFIQMLLTHMFIFSLVAIILILFGRQKQVEAYANDSVKFSNILTKELQKELNKFEKKASELIEEN